MLFDAKNPEHPRAAVDGEGLPFAQREETGDRVHVAIGQHHRLDRTIARQAVGGRMELGCVVDLLPEVWARIEQDPLPSVGADGDRGLRARD